MNYRIIKHLFENKVKVFLTLTVVLIFAFIFLNFLTNTAAADPVPSTIKVIEVRYFPHGQNDVIYQPDNLSATLQTYLSDASKFHGYSDPSATSAVQVEVAGVYNREGARPNPDGTWQSTYNAILAQDNLCDVITSQGIDQVWLWVDPRTGYDPGPGVEYAISSNYFLNSPQYATVTGTPFCGGQRSFLFMGFDDTRPAEYALHSIGHAMEGLIGNLQTIELFWYRFAGNTSQGFPLSERCGNVHYPPNGTIDYNYANTTYVDTGCEDWNPLGTGIQTSYNCTRWGCTQAGYLKWWMQNMPNRDNTLVYKGGRLPNWWDFIQNIDQNIQFYANDPSYFIDRTFLNLYSCNITTQTSSSAQSLTVPVNGCGETDSFLAGVVSYRATLNQNTQRISGMTYNGANMKLGCQTHSNEFVTEIWYFNDPATSGGGNVDIDWSVGAAQNIIAGFQTFDGISDINPVSAVSCNSDLGSWATNPVGKNPFVTIASGDGYKVFGGMTTYTASANVVTFDDTNVVNSWNKKTSNLISVADSVDASNSTTLAWTGTVNWPWSAAAISLRTTASNVAPVLDAIADQSISGGNTFSYSSTSATDANPGDVLTYSLENAPVNMSINSGNGAISWTTAISDYGTYPITVKVTDSGNLTDTRTFSLNVTGNTPVLSQISDSNIIAGNTFTYTVMATDADAGDVLTYSLVNPPANMTIDSSTGAISWITTVPDSGIINITVKVMDLALLSDTKSFNLTIQNITPVLTFNSAQSIVAGSQFTFTATAIDQNPGDTLAFSFVSAPSGATINSLTGVVNFSVPLSSTGFYYFNVKVTDSGLLTNSKVISLTVTAPGINFSQATFVSYAGAEDKSGGVAVSNFGYTVTLTGNTWKAVNAPRTITPNTVLEFDFQSSHIGDIYGIGMEEDLNKTANRIFKVYGTENFGVKAFNNYVSFAPAVHHYVIPIGNYYTGTKNYLVFVNDHDVTNPTAQSVYSNIKIYEGN